MPASITGRHPALLVAAVALPVALVVGVVVVSVLAQRTPVIAPVALSTIEAPDSGSAACASLLAALPDVLGVARRATIAEPAPAGAAAWREPDAPDATDPVVLRCGIDRPAEFVVGSATVGVNGVQFLEISGAELGLSSTTYVDVDRGPYLALTLPDGSGSGSVQQLADIIAKTLPAQALDPAPFGG